ncbi:hypothetical protein O3P69_009034 [Scylla paramamosain]|uniref:Uncharacterized protein n=1 Tax=Scylla paramamosain TaxID=85552 RepID=A0AAW0TR22_SCYPA
MTDLLGLAWGPWQGPSARGPRSVVSEPEKVEVIQDFPRPTTVKKLQQFLGLVIFYHRVVSLAATILSPLHDLKGTKKTSHKPLQWPPVTNAVFMQVKNKLTGLALLAHSVLDAPTVLTNEDDAVGTVV